MHRYLTKRLSKLIKYMIFINLLVISLITISILYSTKYIINNNLSTLFINSSTHIIHRPLEIFVVSIISFGIMILIMMFKSFNYKELSTQQIILLTVSELITSIVIMYYTYFEYNGILFLVFVDTVIYLKDIKKDIKPLIFLIIVLLISSKDVISIFFKIASYREYVELLNRNMSSLIVGSINLLNAINLVLFILFMIILISEQTVEYERIENELSMVNDVNQQLRDYAQITEKMGEDRERKRIAREIHDTLGHALTGVAAGVDACIAMIDINQEKTKAQLQVISKVVRQGIADVRTSLNKLRPNVLESDRFFESIYQLIHDFKEVANVQVDFLSNIQDLNLQDSFKDTIYRTIQESMTNSVRHGKAEKIVIYLTNIKDKIIIDIKDNGDGCTDISKGYGLTHMTERIESLNGTIFYDGENGFHTHIELPLNKEDKND